MFFFARELMNGRIPNEVPYKVDRSVVEGERLQASSFPLTSSLYLAFKNFIAREPSWAPLSGEVDRNREFVEIELRYFLITASYGTTTAVQFLIQNDPQVAKAIEAIPRARKLALGTTHDRAQP